MPRLSRLSAGLIDPAPAQGPGGLLWWWPPSDCLPGRRIADYRPLWSVLRCIPAFSLDISRLPIIFRNSRLSVVISFSPFAMPLMVLVMALDTRFADKTSPKTEKSWLVSVSSFPRPSRLSVFFRSWLFILFKFAVAFAICVSSLFTSTTCLL